MFGGAMIDKSFKLMVRIRDAASFGLLQVFWNGHSDIQMILMLALLVQVSLISKTPILIYTEYLILRKLISIMASTVKMNIIQVIEIWESQFINEWENGHQSKSFGIQINQYSLESYHLTKQTGESLEDGSDCTCKKLKHHLSTIMIG